MLTIRPSLPARAVRAHALKNCLAVVSAVNRLVAADVSEATKGRLSRSQNAVARMVELIEADLLPDPEAGQQPRAGLVSAEEILNAVRTRVEDLAQSRRVHLLFQLGFGSIWGNGHDLAEALGNFVMNAIESSAAEDTVVIATSESAEGGQLWTVSDSGPGIPHHLMPALGIPFKSRRQGGSGLGIAVARDIIERHGGLLRIESALGSGTLVSMWLPCLPPE
jgi:signal transduction histidine kinase